MTEFEDEKVEPGQEIMDGLESRSNYVRNIKTSVEKIPKKCINVFNPPGDSEKNY